MKANCWYGKQDMRVMDVPDPKILNKGDAIIKVTSTAICGSELHLYNGFVPTMEKGDIMGHEFMGEIVEVGPEVKQRRVGDRVVVAFPNRAAGVSSARMSCIRSVRIQTPTHGWQRSSSVILRPASMATRT